MLKKFAIRTLPFLAAFSLGLYLLPRVIELANYQDSQIQVYDVALKMLAAGDMKTAPKALSQSAKLYSADKEDRTWSERFLLPVPDKEVAALAYFHMGNVLMQSDPEKALGFYVESLRYNSGQRMLQGVNGRDDPMHQYGRDFCVNLSDKSAFSGPVSGEECQVLRLQKEADDTRNNMMALLAKHPELAEKLKNAASAGPGPQKGSGGKPGGKDDLPGDNAGPKQGHDDNRKI